MKAVHKIFSFFLGSSSKRQKSFSQIEEQIITGEMFKKSIGSNLILLSKETTMNFIQDDISSFDYQLQVTNIDNKNDSNLIFKFSKLGRD